jgi:heterodisulfide reductase subunit A-like polyferredoxin
LNIELLTLAKLTAIDGEEGNFSVTLKKSPRYVDMDKCIACGLCSEKCPAKTADEFNEGIVKRKAVYVPYAQAVPLKYVIDADRCIYFKKGKCRACEKFCPADAIKFDDTEEIVSLNVGAIIVTAGFQTFDPAAFDNYQHAKFPNVVTSMEFERILSAGGSTAGHVLRPSDRKEPSKIAWLQCVGSWDLNKCGNEYCSSVCCMYAVKEAIISREHLGADFQGTIYYMDMRTHGKDFERYYDRAKADGIRFINSRVHTINQIDESGTLALEYVTDAGQRIIENYDMVVLSVGMEPADSAVEVAQKLGVELNAYNFVRTADVRPVATSRPGIYVAGVIQGCKDIPQSVMEASAAATLKSKDLVRMAVSRAALLEPIPDLAVEINKSALVIGGGIGGMTAALSLADQGFAAVIVERSAELGGAARDIATTWQGEDVASFLDDLSARVDKHPDVEVLVNSEVTQAGGFVGNFETRISSGNVVRVIRHGATVIATGGEASGTDEYLYGKNPKVMRGHDIEQHPEMLADADSVVFIQCVGSRDENRPYCSRICCTTSVSQAIAIKDQHPGTHVYILYRDIRTFGEREVLYKQARAKGVIFIRYSLDDKPTVSEGDDGGLEVRVFDPILQKKVLIKADLINLATAIVPAENSRLAAFYKLPVNSDNFFMEAHAKLRPVDFASDGLFVCGLAHYPKPIDETIAQAMAAAGRAATILAKSSVAVSPLVSKVDADQCIGCGLCVEVCPFGAIELAEIEGKGYRAKNIAASCKGCGLCASSCPKKAIDMLHFRDQQIMAAVCSVG